MDKRHVVEGHTGRIIIKTSTPPKYRAGQAHESSQSGMSTVQRNWTGRQVKDLRVERGQSQTAFGLELYDTTDGTAQSRVSEIERGDREPSSAVRRTLQRMEDGEI